MARSENIIRVLKLPAGAFNKRRPVSDLLWTQVENLAAVVIGVIEAERRAINTEADAGAFIKKYTAFLHPQANGKKIQPSSNGTRKKAAASSSKKTIKKPPRSSRR
ncbi:MAG TPA: hypothetical protein VFY40_14340 [Blastocatellia bacterium]|nr:hypothetical protein [Blastocatellia bacterium]